MNKTPNIRTIVSMSLFFIIIVLFLTAIGIQILDEVIDPEIWISQYLAQENKKSPEQAPGY